MAIAQKCVLKSTKSSQDFDRRWSRQNAITTGNLFVECASMSHIEATWHIFSKDIEHSINILLQVPWQARHGWQVRKGDCGLDTFSHIFSPYFLLFSFCSKMLCYIFKEFLCLVFTHNFVGTFPMLVVRHKQIPKYQERSILIPSYFGRSCECSGNHTNPLNPESTCRWILFRPPTSLCFRCNCMFASQAAHLTTLGTSLLRPRVLRMWEM